LVAWNNHSIVLPFDTRDNRSDFNIVVGAWPEYAFDLGWWPSSARELGMNTWKSRTNQDKNSKLVMIPKNSALIQDIVNSPESADLAGIEAAVTGSAGNMNRMPCSVYK
ncbi:MAG TPA: hypothetical protein PKD04_08960, partial [Rhodocyclaceae bacterium]|nr:hypothetical protein [Rhodocyclaceae bacterium]